MDPRGKGRVSANTVFWMPGEILSDGRDGGGIHHSWACQRNLGWAPQTEWNTRLFELSLSVRVVHEHLLYRHALGLHLHRLAMDIFFSS